MLESRVESNWPGDVWIELVAGLDPNLPGLSRIELNPGQVENVLIKFWEVPRGPSWTLASWGQKIKPPIITINQLASLWDEEPQRAEEAEAPAPIPAPILLCQHSQLDQLVEHSDQWEAQFDTFFAAQQQQHAEDLAHFDTYVTH
ncbi:hypothetical protein MA16_Dca022315 [Dendrobium catenatum]|uniref:Uncharacterized protein n=1 Tax=Dendrobium catenatum TaxID=906689 RepID=A0A2I0XA86_9ASPA|nr:hypothetical protein MA16_Dca022315 [Dendrobium catenatum]